MSDIDEILRSIESREKALHDSEGTLKKIQKAAKSGLATPSEQSALETEASRLSAAVRSEGDAIFNARTLSAKRKQLEKARKVLQQGYYDAEECIPGTESTRPVRHKLGLFERGKQKKAIEKIEGEIRDLEQGGRKQ